MPILVPIMVLIISMMMAIFVFLYWAEEERFKGKLSPLLVVLSSILAISMATWMACASTLPNIEAGTIVVPIMNTQNKDGSLKQFIAYDDQYGQPRFENLNDLFHASVPESSRIKVTEYKTGPYMGIDFGRTQGLQPRYEVVPTR